MAEGLTLAEDEVAGIASGVEAVGVVVRPEIDVTGVGELLDDHEDRSGHRNEGSLLAATADEAAVALAEEGVGLAAAVATSPRYTVEVAVASADIDLGVGLDRLGDSFAQDTRRGGEPGHVETDLGDEVLRRPLGDAGDLAEAFDGAESAA